MAESSPIARCAKCGSERQYHAEPGRMCRMTDFAPMPGPSLWHTTAEARQIIRDMRMLTALADQLEHTYRNSALLKRSGDVIGQLERKAWHGHPVRYEAEGIVGEMLHALESMRDEAIEAARIEVWPESVRKHSDAFDDTSDLIGGHLDSVAKALEA